MTREEILSTKPEMKTKIDEKSASFIIKNPQKTESTVIQFENVAMGYRSQPILSNINLSINIGEYIGIIGPNGSGKTTFLKTLLGLIEPISGAILLNANPINKEVRNSIGYVPQTTTIKKEFPLSVEEAVMMGRYGQIGMLKRPSKKDKDAVTFALHQVHMYHYHKRPIGHLSGGEQQKIMIARALVKKPKILLLDEPTSALDFKMTQDIFQLVQELNEKYHLTIIMVHHNVDLVKTHVKRLLVFDGEIRYDGPPINQKASDIIKLAYNF